MTVENDVHGFLKELKALSDKYKIYFVDLCHIEVLHDYESHYKTYIPGNPDDLSAYITEPILSDIAVRCRSIPIKFNIVKKHSREHNHFLARKHANDEWGTENNLYCSSFMDYFSDLNQMSIIKQKEKETDNEKNSK